MRATRPLYPFMTPEIDAGLQRWMDEDVNPDGSPDFNRRVLGAIRAATSRHPGIVREDGMQELLAWVARHPYTVYLWGIEGRGWGWLVKVLRRKLIDIVRRLRGDRRETVEGARQRVFVDEDLFGATDNDLWRLLTNQYRDAEHKDKPRPHVRRPVDDFTALRQQGDSRAGIPLISRAEAAARVRAVRSISKRDRNLLLAHFVGGWSIRELAASTGASESGLSKRLYRAKQRIRDLHGAISFLGVSDQAA